MDDYIGCMIKRINGGILLYQSELIKKIELQFESEIKDTHDYRTLGHRAKHQSELKMMTEA